MEADPERGATEPQELGGELPGVHRDGVRLHLAHILDRVLLPSPRFREELPEAIAPEAERATTRRTTT